MFKENLPIVLMSKRKAAETVEQQDVESREYNALEKPGCCALVPP